MSGIEKFKFKLLSFGSAILFSLLIISILKSAVSAPSNVPGKFTGGVLNSTPNLGFGGEQIKPSPVSSLTLQSDLQTVRVKKVIDGDTVKIETGEVVRLIGIDAPERVNLSRSVTCFGKESSEYVRKLLEGSLIKLEKDVSEKDRYGRLLRYVWKEDLMVNEFLVREGYATVSTYPPDVKYQERLVEAQRKAREENKGLWSVCFASAGNKQVESTKGKQQAPSSGNYVCDCSKICSQISSCEEAQYQLKICNCVARDADGDGVACDSMCQ